MKSYSIYSTFLFFIKTFCGQQTVQNCPSGIYSWHTRSLEMGCAVGLKYHCILNQYGTLYEVCIERKIYEADRTGCPWIQFYQQETLFGAKNTKCPSSLQGCPPKGHRGYASDHLYIYPLCLVPEEDRVPIRRKNGSIHERENELPRQIIHRSRIPEIMLVTSGVLLLVCLGLLYWMRKKGLPHTMNNHTTKKISGEKQEMETLNECTSCSINAE